MAASREDDLSGAVEDRSGRIVRAQEWADRRDAQAFLAQLPAVVTDGLDHELDVCGEAYRYDLDRRRAYGFWLRRGRVHVCVWKEVDSYVEAASLLSLAVTQDGALNETLAGEIYVRATGRGLVGSRMVKGD